MRGYKRDSNITGMEMDGHVGEGGGWDCFPVLVLNKWRETRHCERREKSG